MTAVTSQPSPLHCTLPAPQTHHHSPHEPLPAACDACHVAAVREPLSYYENNFVGTVNLLKVMSATNCKRIVFSSSATVYGNPHTVPITEDFPLSCTNPYGRTKLFIEEMLRDVAKADPGEFYPFFLLSIPFPGSLHRLRLTI